MSKQTNDLSPNQERRIQIGEQRRAKTRARIIAAAFDLFGRERGVQLRVEDVARAAQVTRATFYSYFENLPALREAVSYELTHEFLARVNKTNSQLDDPAFRAACAIRFYLYRARSDHSWAASMVNISANGIVLGAETYRQCELTIMEGMEAGRFRLRNSALGRDIVLGACLTSMSTMLMEETPEDYPELIAGHVLTGLGLVFEEAKKLARAELPALAELDEA